MDRIKFRTKIEIVLAVVFIISLGVASVASVTRTISNTQDTVYTLIRNTNGNVWDVSQANLQAAINDLGSDGGTVWVGSDFSTSATTIVQDHVTVDLCGHEITYTGSGHCIRLRWGSRIQNGCLDLQNANLGDDDAAIYVDGADQIAVRKNNQYSTQVTGASHMVLLSGGSVGEQSGTGVLLKCDSTSSLEYIEFTRWDDISTCFFKYGYHLACPGGSTSRDNFVNSNQFLNCFDESSKIAIYLTRNQALNHVQSGVDGNMFHNMVLQARSGYWGVHTDYGLWTEGDYGFFNIMTWDFDGIRKYYLDEADCNILSVSGGFSTSVTEASGSHNNIFNMGSEGRIYAEGFTPN